MASSTLISPTGADYNAIFGTNDMRGGGVSDRLRDRLVREEHAKLKRRGWETVTIASLLPFPLSVNLGELGTIAVAAATPGAPVQTLPLKHFRISMRDLGDGNFTPVSVLPTELAKEVEREFHDTGGVFWYYGEGAPPEEQRAKAEAQMFAWFRRLYEQGQDAWSRYHQHALLTDRMRDAARALFTAGEIARLPEWITITREQADRRDCPMCGESIRSTAKMCHFCRSELVPVQEKP